MDINTYKDHVRELCIYPDVGTGSLSELAYVGLGVAGESGEVADCVKKMLRNPDDDDEYFKQRDKLIGEIGDTFFYLVRLCDVLELDPEDIFEANINKLHERRAEGTLKKR